MTNNAEPEQVPRSSGPNLPVKMGVREFGDLLIRTQDLDPAYVGLYGARLPPDQLYRWLLAYWCFYHVGLASWLSESIGDTYWRWMQEAAANVTHPPNPRYERWPRAAERRHFRGQKCVDAVESLRLMSGNVPEFLVRGLTSCRTDKAIMTVVQSWPLFGPWIAFKAADMLERCAGVPVKFDTNLGLMYEEPRLGLRMLIDTPPGDEFNSLSDAYNQLLLHFRSHLAPPAMDRTCGPQEVETVLCKWKSYMGGHYHIGKDINDHRNALEGWGATAEKMRAAMPQRVQL